MPIVPINIKKLLKKRLVRKLSLTDDCCQDIISGCDCSQIVALCPTFWQQVCNGLKSCLQPNDFCVDFTPNPDLCGDFTPLGCDPSITILTEDFLCIQIETAPLNITVE